MEQEKIFNISWGTILRIAFAILVFYLLYLIKGIFVSFIFAVIISVLVDPIIDFFCEKLRFPRLASTITVYTLVFGVLVAFIAYLAPTFVPEFNNFISNFGSYVDKLPESIRAKIDGQTDLATNGFDWTEVLASIFGGLVSAISVLSLAVFLSLEEKAVDKGIRLISPKKNEEFFFNLWQNSKRKVAQWFGVRLLSSLIVGVAVFISLELLNNYVDFFYTPFSLSFSLFAGIADIVPIIGPLIAAVIIFVSLASTSIASALIFLVIFLIIQQIESNIITPLLTKKIIGISPVLVLLAVLIGDKLGGTIGAILAIPLTGMIYEFIKDYLEKKKAEEIYNNE